MASEKRPLKYVYLHSDDGAGTTSIGYHWDRDTGLVYYQYARCSPKDKFCKRIARAICEGRMYKYGPAGEFDGIKSNEALLKAFEDLHPDSLAMVFEVKETARLAHDAKPSSAFGN